MVRRIPRWIVFFILFTVWVVIVSKLNKQSLIYPILFAPVIEELVFRYATIEIIMRNNTLRKVKWQCIILISFVFGVVHMHQNMLLLQGVMGFLMSYLYIFYRDKHTSGLIAYLYVVVFHSLWNTFCTFGLKYII